MRSKLNQLSVVYASKVPLISRTGLTLSTMLVNAGLTTFQKIEETNPREIELV